MLKLPTRTKFVELVVCMSLLITGSCDEYHSEANSTNRRNHKATVEEGHENPKDDVQMPTETPIEQEVRAADPSPALSTESAIKPDTDPNPILVLSTPDHEAKVSETPLDLTQPKTQSIDRSVSADQTPLPEDPGTSTTPSSETLVPPPQAMNTPKPVDPRDQEVVQIHYNNYRADVVVTLVGIDPETNRNIWEHSSTRVDLYDGSLRNEKRQYQEIARQGKKITLEMGVTDTLFDLDKLRVVLLISGTTPYDFVDISKVITRGEFQISPPPQRPDAPLFSSKITDVFMTPTFLCPVLDGVRSCFGHDYLQGKFFPETMNAQNLVQIKDGACGIRSGKVICEQVPDSYQLSGVNNNGATEPGFVLPNDLGYVEAISGGAYQGCVLERYAGSRRVRCFGNIPQSVKTNLGIGALKDLKDVPTLYNPSQISSGGYVGCALHDRGVSCWGAHNNAGILDVPALKQPTLVKTQGSHACVIDGNKVHCWGANESGQADYRYFKRPTKLALGNRHTCALHEDGVTCWGDNFNGSLDVPALFNPTDISSAGDSVCAVDDYGVHCWGHESKTTFAVPDSYRSYP